MNRVTDQAAQKSTHASTEAEQRAALQNAASASSSSKPGSKNDAGFRVNEVEKFAPSKPAQNAAPTPSEDEDDDSTDIGPEWGHNASDELEAPGGKTGLERYRGAGRRLSEFGRAAEEGQLTREQFMFVKAIDAFKRSNNKTFPSWTDVLEVVRLLGYRKTCASELTLRACEDFKEASDAPSNVRPDNWHKRAA